MQPLTTRNRISSIDFVRGIVMVIMALDHTRDFFHIHAITEDPTNMATTTPGLFFTRWITHFCAPTFVFLSGTSAFLYGEKRTKKELSLFLVKRGLWLIFIEVIVMTFALTFNPFYNFIFLDILWAIGVSMLLLGLFIWLPYPLLLTIGLLIIFGHNLLDKAEAANNGQVDALWSILHRPGYILPVDNNHTILFAYPFLAWTGIMILGYCAGKLFKKNADATFRKRMLFLLGSLAILLFITLRFINQYGDRAPWSEQKNSLFTMLSFFNVTKYPPSLLFTLMALGPALIGLAFFENVQGKIVRIFTTYGRVPFFYFMVHFYIIHILCVILFFATGYTAKNISSPQSPFWFRPPQFGFNLWMVYAIWIGVVLLMYPLCRWYNQYKSTHHQWWLSYL